MYKMVEIFFREVDWEDVLHEYRDINFDFYTFSFYKLIL